MKFSSEELEIRTAVVHVNQANFYLKEAVDSMLTENSYLSVVSSSLFQKLIGLPIDVTVQICHWPALIGFTYFSYFLFCAVSIHRERTYGLTGYSYF